MDEQTRKQFEMELELARLRHDVDLLKLQMGDLKSFAEKANGFFFRMESFQTQLEDFDTKLGDKLELFSLRLENKLRNDLEETKLSLAKGSNGNSDKPRDMTWTKHLQTYSTVILWIIALVGSFLNIKLP